MKRNHRLFQPKTLLLLTLALLLGVVGVPGLQPSYASLPKLDNIRVALLMDSGRSFRQTVEAVTLRSETALSVANRTPSGVVEWFQADPGMVRFSADQYRVILTETTDYQMVQALREQLAQKSFPVFVFTRLQGGQPIYQLGIGPYLTKEAAQAARGQAGASSAALAALNPAGIRSMGPMYLENGVYPTVAEARKQAELLQQSHISAYVVYREDTQGGKLVHAVWVGGAADPEQLKEQQSDALKKIANLPLIPADMSKPYMIEHSDVTASNSTIHHYSFSAVPEVSQQIVISSVGAKAEAAESGIQVVEKLERAYRGTLEISLYNNSLAVINELPFEAYLYSVVSTEMEREFPLEALKAQAVSARTYALMQGMKYQIAHISDSTIDQAYKGMKVEFAAAVQAVEETKGEVLVDASGLVTPFYHSNGGGMTAGAEEAWGQPIDYLKAVPSPDDTVQKNKLPWNRIQFPDGVFGYVRSDFVKNSGLTNSAGLTILEGVGKDVNVRKAPYVDNFSNPPIRQINTGDRFTSLGQVEESTSYSWIRGPYTASEIRNRINDYMDGMLREPLQTLEVTQRGASGRAFEVAANGKPLLLTRADNYRTMLGGIPSIRFDIEETGRYTVMGEGGNKKEYPMVSPTPLYVLGAGDKTPRELSGDQWVVLGGTGKPRVITRHPEFRIHGQGYGHGLGMSQWGAKGLADVGYGYQQILQYYYQGVQVVKD
jgi:stage II sporulation protein D